MLDGLHAKIEEGRCECYRMDCFVPGRDKLPNEKTRSKEWSIRSIPMSSIPILKDFRGNVLPQVCIRAEFDKRRPRNLLAWVDRWWLVPLLRVFENGTIGFNLMCQKSKEEPGMPIDWLVVLPEADESGQPKERDIVLPSGPLGFYFEGWWMQMNMIGFRCAFRTKFGIVRSLNQVFRWQNCAADPGQFWIEEISRKESFEVWSESGRWENPWPEKEIS